MGQKLSPEQTELYRRVDEALHYLWDPISVASVPKARDEYWSYLPHVFSLLVTGVSDAKIIDFLVETETETMGFSNRRLAQERAETITSILTNYRDVIHGQLHD